MPGLPEYLSDYGEMLFLSSAAVTIYGLLQTAICSYN